MRATEATVEELEHIAEEFRTLDSKIRSGITKYTLGAEAEKNKRYPPSRGRYCTPVASLCSGFMSEEAERLLGSLAHKAQERRKEEGLSCAPLLPKWRLELARHAASWLANAVVLSLAKPDVDKKALASSSATFSEARSCE